MDNEQRSDYGAAVIEYSGSIAQNTDDEEGVARDAISNIIHYLVRSGIKEMKEIHGLLGSCAYHVEVELAEEDEDEGGKEE